MDRFLLIFCLSLLLVGCTPYESILNYNEGADYFSKEQPIENSSSIIIQANDILEIRLNSIEREAIEMFNEYSPDGYLVSENGNIDFPLVGSINLKGKTLDEARNSLLEALGKYFNTAPSINILLKNYNVTVNGEVGSPGSFNIPSGRISIIEAITRGGDFTEYSRRDSILIIREEGDNRSFGYLDFNSSEIFKSPYFYLKQNDVVYVMPRKNKLGTIRSRESKALPYISIVISAIFLAVAINR